MNDNKSAESNLICGTVSFTQTNSYYIIQYLQISFYTDFAEKVNPV